MFVLLLAVALMVSCGIAALCLSHLPRAATLVGAGGVVVGCLLGMSPTLGVLIGGAPETLRLTWDAAHGAFVVEVDSLSAFFLAPVLGLSALAAVYGGNYLLAYRHEKALGSSWFLFSAFVGGMVMVLVARTALLFLVAWEVMSIAAYCLVTFEHEKAEVREAGWIYLVATHLGVLFVLLAFLLLGHQAGSLEFREFRTMSALSVTWADLIFVLALVGFGTKAGIVPFHVWLPEAHPAAPSHVSALMSGVMIKMGLYGLLRTLTFLGAFAAWWGLALAGLGLLTSLVGIALASHQRDIKRVLAYSSIENMGLITLALGVGIWGWASDLPAVGVLGIMAALLHIWNHALMKGLMFFAAGSVVHATGTKDIEKLGGLMKRMPWTGNALLLGALAIAALPPLNGFVGKWLMYLSLLKAGLSGDTGQSLTSLLAIGLLALIGGLAAVAFVRLSGIVLLGSPRSEAAEVVHESSPWMIVPMLLLVFLCLTAAVIPQSVAALTLDTLDQVLGRARGTTMLDLGASDAPLQTLGNFNVGVVVAGVAMAAVLLALTRKSLRAQGATWGCGYAKPTTRMQYTGRSFAEMIADNLLPGFLRPRTARDPVRGLFPSAGKFATEYLDPVSNRWYGPFFRRCADRFARLRILQQGKLHVYLVYIMLTVFLALAWTSLRTWWWGTT